MQSGGDQINQIVKNQKIVDETINEIKRIPKAYLMKCDWFDYLSENLNGNKVNPKTVIKVHIDNMSIAKKCFILHNSLVDFILENNL